MSNVSDSFHILISMALKWKHLKINVLVNVPHDALALCEQRYVSPVAGNKWMGNVWVMSSDFALLQAGLQWARTCQRLQEASGGPENCSSVSRLPSPNSHSSPTSESPPARRIEEKKNEKKKKRRKENLFCCSHASGAIIAARAVSEAPLKEKEVML